MSSNPGSQAPAGSERDLLRIGLASSFRRSVAYALLFAAVSTALLAVAYLAITRTIYERELETVRNHAAEYRAWFVRGDAQMLAARMDEQSLQTGEVMFVHIKGRGLNYVKFKAPDGGLQPMSAVHAIDPRLEGYDVNIEGERWVVASVELDARGLVLQAGKNARASDALLRRLRGIFILTLLPAILAATLAGTVWGYYRMRPVRSLAATMRDILQSGNLSQRVKAEPGANELNELVELFNKLLAGNEKLIDGMQHALETVAHDFRTPLSRLNMTAQRALTESEDPAAMREALADCVEESDYLGKLLFAVMDVAEAEAGAIRLNLETFSLAELIDSVTDLYEFVAEERGVTLETQVSEDCRIRADRTRLNQALANLLDNAIKFSGEGGRVRIGLEPTDGGGARITVSDEGAGIQPSDLPHVWDRLYRAEMSRTSPGMGLGLSFVKAIIKAHGGRADLQSSVGEGTVITIELPHESGPGAE